MPLKSKKTATEPPKTAADIEAAMEELQEQAKARLKAEREADYLKNKAAIDKLVKRMGSHLKTTEPHVAHLAILRLLGRRFDFMPKAKRTGGNLCSLDSIRGRPRV